MLITNPKKKAVWLINAAFYSFITVSIFILIKYFTVYILPFVISFTTVYLLQRPMCELSIKTGVKKNVLTLFSLIIIFSAITLIIGMLFYKSIMLLIDLNNKGEFEIMNNIYDFCLDSLDSCIPKNTRGIVGDTEQILKDAIKSGVDCIVSMFGKAIKQLPNFIFSTATSIVSACFLAFEYDKFIIFIKSRISTTAVEKITKIKLVVNSSLLGLAKGYLILMFYTFLIITGGLLVLGIKNAPIIALIISLVDILPVLGTGIVLIPWGILEIFSGNVVLGAGLIILYIAYSILRYFIEPKIVGKKVGVNPLLSLIIMFVGLKLFGIIGLFLGPITLSVVTVLYKNKVILS